MPLNHADAAASISVTGLALGCFNPKKNQWEVGFIRHSAHTLAMVVLRHTKAGLDLVRVENDFPHDAKIFIKGDRPIPPRNPFFRSKGDEEDFDLVLDIEKEVYSGNRIGFLDPPTCVVTPLFVSEPELYSVASKLSRFPLETVLKDQPSTVHKKFGHKGTAVGADIKCKDAGGVTIRVEGTKEFELPLPRAAGTRYSILFDNTCPHADADSAEAARSREEDARKFPDGPLIKVHSDFVLYYSVIDDKGMGKFDLREDKPNRGPGAICNKSFLGLTEQMFPPLT